MSNLPHKDGKLDMEQYGKYKDGGLRQKLHDAIRARKCIRCMVVGHLRSTCPESPKSWEADFNSGKAAFWGPKVKQARPQWLPSTPTLRGPKPSANLLWAKHCPRHLFGDFYWTEFLNQSPIGRKSHFHRRSRRHGVFGRGRRLFIG